MRDDDARPGPLQQGDIGVQHVLVGAEVARHDLAHEGGVDDVELLGPSLERVLKLLVLSQAAVRCRHVGERDRHALHQVHYVFRIPAYFVLKS